MDGLHGLATGLTSILTMNGNITEEESIMYMDATGYGNSFLSFALRQQAWQAGYKVS